MCSKIFSFCQLFILIIFLFLYWDERSRVAALGGEEGASCFFFAIKDKSKLVWALPKLVNVYYRDGWAIREMSGPIFCSNFLGVPVRKS